MDHQVFGLPVTVSGAFEAGSWRHLQKPLGVGAVWGDHAFRAAAGALDVTEVSTSMHFISRPGYAEVVMGSEWP